ncbi:hypothetical protein QBC36DRAFT_346756 [Triangularia setosa]|uniref:Uncharacterized protein n=1 Tax=Triangularia setosa TaxID=2587417 RepID=A0AAN6W665_9PEZI|nr:hypothetical protein QBC36DRAFT_346756 [Podospora setosa]
MEAIALFGTVLGILKTFRDFFPSLAADATEWQKYELFDLARWLRLAKIIKDVERWQRRWMVYCDETEPESNLQSKFWGDAARGILNHLESINNEVTKLKKLLSIRKIDQGGCFVRFRKKGRDVLFRSGGNLNKVLDALDTLVSGLESRCNEAYWRLRQRNFDEKELPPPDTLDLHRSGLQHHLVKLAMHTWKTSNQLRDCCLNTGPRLELDIELDLFFRQQPQDGVVDARSPWPVVPRSQVIATASHTNCLGYTLLVGEPDHGVRRRRVRLTPDPGRSLEKCKTHFSDAFHIVLENAKGCDAGLELVTRGTRVTMGLDELQRIVGNLPEPTSLRSQLNSQPATTSALDDKIRRMDHRIRKMKRAFHISEFCLLFFKSSWMKWICSCNIQEYDLASLDTTTQSTIPVDRQYLFALKRMGKENSDVPPVAANGLGAGAAVTLQPCWCQMKCSPDAARDGSVASNLKKYPLFSLGLILIEIGLERALRGIRIKGALVEAASIFFEYQDPSDPNKLVERSLRDLETMFDGAAGDYGGGHAGDDQAKRVGADFYAAIKFCLESRLSPGVDPFSPGIDVTKLEPYFVEVVWKLYTMQEDLIEKREEFRHNGHL